MFENTLAYRRMKKKQHLLDLLEKAKADGCEYKVVQLESKIAIFNSKNYPNIVWDSSKGTYHNPDKKKKRK